MHILDQLGISRTVQALVERAESSLSCVFDPIEKTAELNQYKVIEAFRAHNVGARHFAPTTGYGYSDEGRQALADVFAHILQAQEAVLSPHIASGTHAISIALYAVLRPGDTLISVTGKPYDTLHHVIGIGSSDKDTGSLTNFGVKYRQVELPESGVIDVEQAAAADDHGSLAEAGVALLFCEEVGHSK